MDKKAKHFRRKNCAVYCTGISVIGKEITAFLTLHNGTFIDMKSWKEKVRFTDFPGAFNYTDGFYEDGHIYFTVEHNRHTIIFFDVEMD